MPIKTKRKKPKRRVFLTLFNVFLITLILSIVITAGVVFTIIQGAIAKLPEIDVTKFELNQSPKVFDANGSILFEDMTDKMRRVVKYEDISPNMINAIVAIEDKTFFTHKGFNFVRILGAVKEAITSDDRIGGTSTITQQLARDLYLTKDRSIIRKIQEGYLAIKMEERMSKEDIISTYLNSIYLGANSNGVEAAANTYFSKSAKDLDIVESAIIASLPQSPTRTAPMVPVKREDYDGQGILLTTRGTEWVYLYNDRFEPRYRLVLKNMLDQEKITQAEYDEAMKVDLPSKLKPSSISNIEFTTYFKDMVAKDVIKRLMEEFQITEEEASNRFYTQGMNVYTTLDTAMQKKVENVINESGDAQLYSDILSGLVKQLQKKYKLETTGIMNPATWDVLINKGYVDESMRNIVWNIGDRDGLVLKLKNALTSDGIVSTYQYLPSYNALFRNGMLYTTRSDATVYAASNYLDIVSTDGTITIPKQYYKVADNGDVHIARNNLVKFAKTKNDSLWVGLSPMFDFQGNKKGANWNGRKTLNYYLLYRDFNLAVPKDMATINEEGVLILKKEFLDSEDGFKVTDAGLSVPKSRVTRPDAPVLQPQIAISIVDPFNGFVKVIIGGRGVVGNKLFNRATEPQQPGSSIKPIAVYGPAIDTHKYTAASVVDDTPTFRFNRNAKSYWPKNVYRGFRGRVGLREALCRSINVIAVKTANGVGIPTIVEYLEKNGITRLVKEGQVSDMALASLALGGMANGIAPLEMSSAYGTFANQGVHVPWTTFSKLTDADGNVIIDNTQPKGTQVFSKETSWIMLDIMQENVDRYLGKDARIRNGNRGIPISGKTGTTSDQFDLAFSGVSPYYACTVWIGSDIDVSLNGYSDRSAKVFSEVMKAVHEGLPNKDFFARPETVVSRQIDGASGLLPGPLSSSDPRGSQVRSEWFIKGTVPTKRDDAHVAVEVCTETNMKAGPYCPTVGTKVLLTRVDPDDDMRGFESMVMDQKYVYEPKLCTVHLTPPPPPTTEPVAPVTPPTTPNPPATPNPPTQPPQTP